jgi:hypothetical protein
LLQRPIGIKESEEIYFPLHPEVQALASNQELMQKVLQSWHIAMDRYFRLNLGVVFIWHARWA